MRDAAAEGGESSPDSASPAAPTDPTTATPDAPPAAGGESEDVVERGLSGQQVRSILTDTLVESPDMVAIFASVGREALWANDAFVTLIPIREADQIWLVELLDEWSRGHYEVKVLPALVKLGRWRGRLTFVSDDGPVPVSAVHRRPPRRGRARSAPSRWSPATWPSCAARTTPSRPPRRAWPPWSRT